MIEVIVGLFWIFVIDKLFPNIKDTHDPTMFLIDLHGHDSCDDGGDHVDTYEW